MKRLFYLALLFVVLPVFSFTMGLTQTPDSLLISLNRAKSDSAQLETLRQILNYWKVDISDSTVYYSKQLIRKAEETNQISKAYKGYYWLTSSFSVMGQQDSVLYYSFKGLDLFACDTSYFYPQSVLLLTIGEQFRAMEQFDKATTYLLKAWEVCQKSERKEVLVGTANRLAAVYHENEQHDLAVLWADSSIKLANSYQNYNYLTNSQIIKAAVWRDQGKFELAKNEFEKVLENDQLDDITKVELYNNIASTYVGLNQAKQVIKYAKKSYDLSTELGINAYSVVSSELMATAYYDVGDYQTAFYYLREYEALRHQIFFQDRDAEIARLSALYENEKKELFIEHQKEKLTQKDWEIKVKNFILISFAIIFIVLILLIFILFLTKNKLRKAHQLLIDRNQQIESQKTDIEGKAKVIEDAYEQLKDLDAQKQAFVNMLVHDLKNPLNLLINLDVFEDRQERKMLVNRSAKQMLNMVMNILDVSASEERELKLFKGSFNFLDLIHSAIQDVDFLCIGRELEINYISDFDFELNADYDIIHRVFVNFFTNAIKHSPRSSSVIVKALITENDQLEISVKDSGPGIKPEDQIRIFQKFEQVHEAQSSFRGSTGLGLAFCKLAVEAHKWEIGLDSKPGFGARFFIVIDHYKKLPKN